MNRTIRRWGLPKPWVHNNVESLVEWEEWGHCLTNPTRSRKTRKMHLSSRNPAPLLPERPCCVCKYPFLRNPRFLTVLEHNSFSRDGAPTRRTGEAQKSGELSYDESWDETFDVFIPCDYIVSTGFPERIAAPSQDPLKDCSAWYSVCYHGNTNSRASLIFQAGRSLDWHIPHNCLGRLFLDICCSSGHTLTKA